jgi:hypothetical protein
LSASGIKIYESRKALSIKNFSARRAALYLFSLFAPDVLKKGRFQAHRFQLEKNSGLRFNTSSAPHLSTQGGYHP